MKITTIPYQSDTDFTYQGEDEHQDRPQLPAFLELSDGLIKPEDIPLNRRNFIYTPCSANVLFPELKYSTTEYPFEQPGLNYMDRADDLCLAPGSNDTVAVQKSLGWRTGRCDACIKEGTVYWEVEIVNGGVPDSQGAESLKLVKDKLNSTPHVRVGVSRREASLEAPVGFDAYGYGIRDFCLESVHDGKLQQMLPVSQIKAGDRLGFLLHLPPIQEQVIQAQSYTKFKIDALSSYEAGAGSNTSANADGPLRKKAKKLNREFQKELLREQEHSNVVRDQIAIRYKNQLFFEATDYVKTTKPEYYTSDRRERHDYYTLQDSYLKVFLNGKELGTAFEKLNPFLPPFSEIKYNEKLNFNYWKNEAGFGDADNLKSGHDAIRKKSILRNKYVNNGRLGYYATISCFNGGSGRLVTSINDMHHWNPLKASTPGARTLQDVFEEQVAEDVVWDIIDEVEAEMLCR
ncbi:SPRY domain-containing protein [Lachancea thermotolerans]